MIGRLLPLMIALALIATACGDSRPARAEWQGEWERTALVIPGRAAFVAGPDEELCADALVIVRDAGDELLPTPDPALDAPVDAWLAQAREIFLECPPRAPVEGFDEAYQRLDALRAEVDAGLARIG